MSRRAILGLLIAFTLFSCEDSTARNQPNSWKTPPPVLRQWIASNHLQCDYPVILKSPSHFSDIEMNDVKKFCKKKPNQYSSAIKLLEEVNDSGWAQLTIRGVGNSGSVNMLNDYRTDEMRSSGTIVAWPIVTKKSDNVFGDMDQMIIIFTNGENVISYALAIWPANEAKRMGKLGIYVPINVLAKGDAHVGTLGEIKIFK